MYNITEGSYEIGASSSIDSSNSLKGSLSETRLHWHQKAIVSVMEAGGLNWLVGKLGSSVYHLMQLGNMREPFAMAAKHILL